MTHFPAPAGLRLGIVRGISYGLFAPPDPFVPEARALGARLIRAYLYWGQVEPSPGRFVWDALDALLAQLDGTEEVWLTLCCSSPWATRQSTDFLPPSPAHSLDAYAEFVRQVVQRATGRVRYWQCDNEPSNTDLLWAGTAQEYVAQLRRMSAVVRAVDPSALVVLGGCGYDVFSSGAGSEQRAFFDHLTRAGGDAFDVFDVHLYGDPYRIPEYVDTARQLMRAHGYAKPIVAGEYAGPSLFEFPELEGVTQQALASAFAAAPATQSTEDLKAQIGQDTPERRAMRALYARMADLPPRLQMFMAGCPPELEAKRHRISARQLVVRNVLALAQGIRRTSYWNLANEVPGPVDHFMIMHLLFGKLPLLEYRGTRLEHHAPEADAFARLARYIDGASSARRLDVGGEPASVHAFELAHPGAEPCTVVWDRRDAFDGECAPTIDASLRWTGARACVRDIFGQEHSAEVGAGRLRLAVSDTPMFVTAA